MTDVVKGNATGRPDDPYFVDDPGDGASFECLPRRLRDLLNDAPYSISATDILKVWRDEGEESALNMVRVWCLSQIAAEARRLYGPQHPQAKGVKWSDVF